MPVAEVDDCSGCCIAGLRHCGLRRLLHPLGELDNSEIYGNVTDLPWGFIFEIRGETEPKHPTQLYEGFTYLLLGFVLLDLFFLDWAFKKRNPARVIHPEPIKAKKESTHYAKPLS